MGRSSHHRGSASADEVVQDLDLLDSLLLGFAFLTMVLVVIVAAIH